MIILINQFALRKHILGFTLLAFVVLKEKESRKNRVFLLVADNHKQQQSEC
ncbi:MAG: hypothetical protein ACI83B_002850 [Sediminicola sp.]|jgi:hypothetical protein